MNADLVTHQWHLDSDCLRDGSSTLRQSILIIAGPSGSGKSSIANALSVIDSACFVLCNYTTRPPRLTDHPGHFGYLSDHDFTNALAGKRFFLARLGPFPRYGYRTSDLVDTISNGIHPILMFRHAGIRYLSESVGAIPTVFIEGDPTEIARHSQNVLSPPTEEHVSNTLAANRRLQEQMAQERWPFLRIANHFEGENELQAIAQRIRDFVCMKVDAVAVHQRELSITGSRYGVSLVAGRPLPENLVDSIVDVDNQLTDITETGIALVHPKNVHLTILRGQSSSTPCPLVSPPQEIALAVSSMPPSTISWSGVSLGTDGTIRALAIPVAWPITNKELLYSAIKSLSRVYGIRVSVQPRLWATLGTIGPTVMQQDTLNRVRALLSRCLLPSITVTQLRLVHYRDLYMNNVDTLETYDLQQ